MAWDVQVDVVSVGSGVGGLTAAATAAELGLDVLLVEKDHKLGGVTARSGGQLWAGATDLEESLGIADTVAETEAYLEGLSQGLAIPALRATYARESPGVMRYLGAVLGVPLRVIRDLPDYYHLRLPGSKAEGRYLEVEPLDAAGLGEWADRTVVSPYDDLFSYVTFAEILAARAGTGRPLDALLPERVANDQRCAGAGLSGWLLKAALERGVEVRVETRAVELIGGPAGVEGIVIEGPGGRQRIRARAGVLLATGGYDWHAGMVEAYEALPEVGSMAPVTVEGDHLTMTAALGVEPVLARTPAQTPIFVGYRVPGREVDGNPMHRCWSPGHPHSFIVNQAGRRFADDGFYPDLVGKVVGRDEGGQPNWPAWLVFDQAFFDLYGLSPIRPGETLPAELAVTASSLPELAAAAGIDPDGLGRTVERFNAACVTGVDADFGRGDRPWSRTMIGNRLVEPNPNLAPVDRAPFYAVKLERVAMGVATAGLPIDEAGRVLGPEGQPVPGLYAAGNSAAWRDIGGGYNSGIANTRGALFGHLAARDMALAGTVRVTAG